MTKIALNNVRLAFPSLWTPTRVKGKSGQPEGDPAFSASFIFAESHPAYKIVKDGIEATAKEKWGPKAPAILKAIFATDKCCLHDGDLKAQYEGYEGNFFVSSRSKTRPTIINRDRTPLVEADGVIYSGCFVNALLELWPQDNGWGKRINASLRGVQFYANGDAFSGGAKAADSDEFEELSVEDQDDITA